MKQLSGKWKIKRDGSMILKWKKRKVEKLTLLDIITTENS